MPKKKPMGQTIAELSVENEALSDQVETQTKVMQDQNNAIKELDKKLNQANRTNERLMQLFARVEEMANSRLAVIRPETNHVSHPEYKQCVAMDYPEPRHDSEETRLLEYMVRELVYRFECEGSQSSPMHHFLGSSYAR